MDNVTHSLAGLLLAATAVEVRARRRSGGADDRSFAPLAAVTGIAGANLPDIDVVWSAALQGAGVYDGLLSLLHHRGYTHTLLAAVVCIPMLWLAALWFRRRQLRDTITSDARRACDRHTLLALSIVAVLSHLSLDFTNDYGVHPFSPFVDRWAYGDSVFIIEPWLWVAAVPMLLRTVVRRGWRWALGGVLGLGVTLCWVVPLVSLAAAAVVTIGAVVMLLLAHATPVHRAPMTGIVVWVIVTVLSASGTYLVRQSVRTQAVRTQTVRTQAVAAAGRTGQRAPAVDDFRLLDVMTSPSPANPLCSRVITVEATREEYRLTTAWGSAVPWLVSATWCSRAVKTDTTRGARTLPMQRASRVDTPALEWQWTWGAPRAALIRLAAENCRVSTWLRFVRAPFWVPAPGDSVRVGDLRYDRDRASVAAFTFSARREPCPRAAPPWTRPRADLLSADGAD